MQGAAEGDTVKLFQEVLGVYMCMNDEPVPADIQKWNVKVLPLHRNNRHEDAAIVGRFYEALDKFLNSRPDKTAKLAL